MRASMAFRLAFGLLAATVAALPGKTITYTITGPLSNDISATETATATLSSSSSKTILSTITGTNLVSTPATTLSSSSTVPSNATASSHVPSATASIPATGDAFLIMRAEIYGDFDGNTTLKFSVYDPDPKTNATAVCNGTWSTQKGGYPENSYKPCGNGFAWNMQDYNSYAMYQLGIVHSYNDSTLGEYPYDRRVNFAEANVTTRDTECSALAGRFWCQQKDGVVIYAPITRTIARRRSLPADLRDALDG